MLSKITLTGRHEVRLASGRGILTGLPSVSTTGDTELSVEFRGFPILRRGESRSCRNVSSDCLNVGSGGWAVPVTLLSAVPKFQITAVGH
jgi:hypothetical protein